MAESGHDYLEILPDETEVAMNRPSVEIPLLGADSGKDTGDLTAALDDTDVRFLLFVCQIVKSEDWPHVCFSDLSTVSFLSLVFEKEIDVISWC